jgi:AraC-like DNA-binding protein
VEGVVNDDEKRPARADGEAGRTGANGIRAARLHAIKSDILENLRQRSFSIHGVASRHGITVNYVRQLFAAEGTSFAQFVLQQRLAAAHLILSDPSFAHRTVSEIAFEVGFGDLLEFNRAFRRRYGMTPVDMREKARSDRQS